jgi:hypothetical protein
MPTEPEYFDISVTRREVETLRRLITNELRFIERQMLKRAEERRNVQQSQWWHDRLNQKKNLESLFESLKLETEEPDGATIVR